MSKTMLVTLPFILLLLDWWPLGRFRRLEPGVQSLKPNAHSPQPTAQAARESQIVYRVLLEKLPFLAASVVCGLLTVQAEKGVGAMHTMSDIPAPERGANAILGCGRYLIQMAWPHGLAVFYPYPRAFTLWTVLFAGLAGVIARPGVVSLGAPGLPGVIVRPGIVRTSPRMAAPPASCEVTAALARTFIRTG